MLRFSATHERGVLNCGVMILMFSNYFSAQEVEQGFANKLLVNINYGDLMQIIIDTNIFRQDLFLRSRKSEMLIDYLSKTEHQLVLPEIVFREILALYKRTLVEKFGNILKGYDDLARVLFNPVDYQKPSLEIGEQLEAFENNLRKKLHIIDKNIITIKNSHLPDLVNRAINRIHPFSESKAEFRDALIWLTVLDQASLAEDKTITFISANTKEFSDTQDTLHPKLLEEAKARDVVVEYYSSLDSFIKSKASKIEFITERWLNESLDFETIESDLIRILEKYRIKELADKAKVKDDNFTEISAINQCANIWVSDFYVYEMLDGSIRVEIVLEAELEVEYATHEVIEHDWKLDYVFNPYEGEFDVEPVHERKVIKESGYKCFYPTAEFEVHVVLRDHVVESTEIVDWYV